MLLNVYANNHSCNEILSAIVMSYPEDILFYCTLPHLLGLTFFLCYLLQCTLGLRGDNIAVHFRIQHSIVRK